MKKSPGDNARLVVVSMLDAVLDEKLNLGDAERHNTLRDPRDRAFARHLTFGVLRWLTALEWLGRQLLRRPLKQRDRNIHRLILIGLFQLWKDNSAQHAAINETAECARKLGKPWAVGVINAILRRFQREQELWLDRLANQEERFAHPEWLLGSLRQEWPDHWEGIVAANNQAAPLWLRLARNYPAPDTIAGLEQAGFTVEHHPSVPGAVKVSPAAAVNELPGFRQGLFSVQDPAAQLAAGLLDAKNDHRILDACAAPGGKTCHILETAAGAQLTALDRSAERLALVRENLDRLGFSESEHLRLLNEDAAEPRNWWDGKPFDRILLDAPCTATGVIRRHPEIKWLRSPEQVSEAASLQSSLLDQLWPLLRPGGILLYATCSILKLENGEQIRKFAEEHPDAELTDLDATWGLRLGPGRQILPGEQEMDGFFYARLRKQS